MYRVIFMLVGAALVGLALVLFRLNGYPVTVAFPLFEIEVSLSAALALCFVSGITAGFFLVGWWGLSHRRRVRKLKDKAAVAEQEVFHLRRNVIQD